MTSVYLINFTSQSLIYLSISIFGWCLTDYMADLNALIQCISYSICPITVYFQIFNDSLYQMLKKVLKDIIVADIAFAWRAFNFDATSKNILSIPVGSRPGGCFKIIFYDLICPLFSKIEILLGASGFLFASPRQAFTQNVQNLLPLNWEEELRCLSIELF